MTITCGILPTGVVTMAIKVLHNRCNTCTLDKTGICLHLPSIWCIHYQSNHLYTFYLSTHCNYNIYPQISMNVHHHRVDKYVQILLEAISAPVMMGMNWTMMEELVMVCCIDDTV